jgi:RNA polymerase sigma factor (TIGR02999 family)
MQNRPPDNPDADTAARITTLTRQADAGDAPSKQQLFELLYAELHRMARRELWKNDGGSATLSATALVHEAYLSLSKAEGLAFPDKPRFMAYAARAMRGLIIDHARERRALKRGGGFEFTTLSTELGEQTPEADNLQSLSDALEALAALDAPLAEVVDLKFFCGLTFGEIATLRGVSERTVQRDWEKARLMLHRSLA